MFLDVEIKIKKRNKLLFSRDSKCLQGLIELIQLQNHRTIVMRALDCAKQPLEQFEASKDKLLLQPIAVLGEKY